MLTRTVFKYCRRTLVTTIYCYSLMFSIPAHAQNPNGHLRLKLASSIGYAEENLSWSIAGKNSDGELVNVFSELRWKQNTGVHINIEGELYVWKELFVKGSLSKTLISSGTVSDSDFGKDHRRDTVFYDVFDSNEGGVTSYRATIGYALSFLKKHSISPLAGYGNDAQSLHMLREYGNVQGDLNSTYKTKWNGPFAGFDLRIVLHRALILTGGFTYHQTKYYAKANWNLIQDFHHPISFEHRAKGYGLSSGAGIEYLLHEQISIRLNANYNRWITGKGTDILYRSNGDVIVTQLNSVQRTNLILSLGAQVKL